MENINSFTTISLSILQLIGIVAFFIFNTLAISAAWYKFGSRIKDIETKQCALTDDFNSHRSAYTQMKAQTVTDMLEIKTLLVSIQSSLFTHLEIHRDRELIKPRTPIS